MPNGTGQLLTMSVKLEDNYFSDTLKWTVVIGSVLISGYLIYAGHHQWIGLGLFIITLISFSTKYVFEVDLKNKLIIDSFYFLWIRVKSEQFKFNTLNGIRLDKQRHVYNATTRSRVRQADFNEYIATLEYDHSKSIELERKMEYQPLVDQVSDLARQLNISIQRTF